MLYLTNKNENVISTVFASYAHGFQTFTSGECLETVMGVWGRVCPALAGDRERRRCKRRAILGQGPDCVTSTVRFFVTAACLSGRRLAPKWSFLLRVLFTVEMDMTWHDMNRAWVQGELFCWNKRERPNFKNQQSLKWRTSWLDMKMAPDVDSIKQGFWICDESMRVVRPACIFLNIPVILCYDVRKVLLMRQYLAAAIAVSNCTAEWRMS